MKGRAKTLFVWAMLLSMGIAAVAWQVRVLRSAPGQTRSGNPPRPSVEPGPRISAEGRLETRPGARVTVSSEVVGVLTNILVQEKSAVKRGDLIAEIQADDVFASLMEARARVREFEAELELAEFELRRGRKLAETRAITEQELDRLTKGFEVLEARRNTAQVTVRRLEITLAKTRVVSPLDGVVLVRHVHPGEVVTGGMPLVTVADLKRIWIEAEVDEYDGALLAVGAAAMIRAEGYTNEWRGRVEEIPDSVGPRGLHPQDPARPSDVRVLRVKIAVPDRPPLRLGQRVEVEIRPRPLGNGGGGL